MNVNAIIPDIATPNSEAPTITPLPAGGAVQPNTASSEPSFKDQVMGLIQDVNERLNTSDQNVRDLAMGKTNDLDKVVTSVEEANLALQYTIAIRSKLLDAYNEVARISI
ncbi:MAG: flagellar hook-basal body complex protein FliE [Candidatus Eremiobacteraeota bacterium]|nr:flagellar hook-basal body complex protein FliE [Candidatus Eremiobacteraeota bacterium]